MIWYIDGKSPIVADMYLYLPSIHNVDPSLLCYLKFKCGMDGHDSFGLYSEMEEGKIILVEFNWFLYTLKNNEQN